MDYIKMSAFLFGSAVALVISALGLATSLAKTPLEQLGLKPRGSNLWEWLLNYYVTDTTGIYGYDTIQGALAPPLRVQCHLAALLAVWGLLTIFCGELQGEDAECGMFQLPVGVWRLGSIAFGIYTMANLVVHHFMDGVSMPGGPRQHRMMRTPKWEDKTTLVEAPGWKFLSAQDSHDLTHRQFPGHKLTGEPAGRQVWTQEAASNKEFNGNVVDMLLGLVGGGGKNVDEKLVQTLAKGGRAEFGFNPSKNPNSCDMIFRGQQIRKFMEKGGTAPDLQSKPNTVHEASKKAAQFYSMLQCDDGHWAADYGGPHFLMPGLITVWYIMGKPENFLNASQVALMKHYILVHQQSDGGWGSHLESPSTMFGSTLMYVALRLLGVPADHPAAIKGSAFIREQGGALYTSSWSKFYLCILGCMDWKGHNSVPPEMWLLPNWFPFHPGRMWCHARMVYLPMGYLYGHRFVYTKAESDPLILALRKEIYCQPYEKVDWVKTRHWVAPMDNYSPIPIVMKVVQNILARYENWDIFQPFKKWIREKGLEFCMAYIRAEDLQTNYIDIGPVNKVLNMMSHFHGKVQLTWLASNQRYYA